LNNNKTKPVLTKVDFVRRYQRGQFGNRAPTWDNLSQFLLSDYKGLVHIRNRVAGGMTWYNVPADLVVAHWRLALSMNYYPRQLYISAMCPTERTVFQGEVRRGLCGLDLHYTTVRRPMREALSEEEHNVSGIIAISLLRYYLCSNSYEWLSYLLDAYQDHVIEFTTLDTNWGTVSGYNTVFWECRAY